MSTDLYKDAVVVDGLVISKWGPDVFRALHDGGVTAANCTSAGVWDGLFPTMRALAQWHGWFRDCSDAILQINSTEDIYRAKRENKVGIILGWQNTSPYEDYLPFVRLYAELGVKVVQLTYNTATSVGSGCYESKDGGLTDFGRELVAELNRERVLIDLSHVGPRTAQDALEASSAPVVYSHVCPSALKSHPRNKTDEQLRQVVERGGLVGVTMFPTLLPKGPDSDVDDYLDVIEYVINIVGEDNVGIGTDFSQGRGEPERYYTAHDKGHARKLVEYGDLTMPKGVRRIEEFHNIGGRMQQRGWSDARVERVLGKNWIRVLGEVWGS